MSSCSNNIYTILSFHFPYWFCSSICYLYGLPLHLTRLDFLHCHFPHSSLNFSYRFCPYSRESNIHKYCIFHIRCNRIVCIHLWEHYICSCRIWCRRGGWSARLWLLSCCCEMSCFCIFGCYNLEIIFHPVAVGICYFRLRWRCFNIMVTALAVNYSTLVFIFVTHNIFYCLHQKRYDNYFDYYFGFALHNSLYFCRYTMH